MGGEQSASVSCVRALPQGKAGCQPRRRWGRPLCRKEAVRSVFGILSASIVLSAFICHSNHFVYGAYTALVDANMTANHRSATHLSTGAESNVPRCAKETFTERIWFAQHIRNIDFACTPWKSISRPMAGCGRDSRPFPRSGAFGTAPSLSAARAGSTSLNFTHARHRNASAFPLVPPSAIPAIFPSASPYLPSLFDPGSRGSSDDSLNFSRGPLRIRLSAASMRSAAG